MSNPSNCITNCLSAPPPAEFDNCAPELQLSQIEYIYVANENESLNNWTSAAEWAARIDNTGTTGNEIRQIRVIGQKPKATSNVKDISGGRKYRGPKAHVLTAIVDETNDTNYEFLRSNECSPGKKTIWFETLDDGSGYRRLYGGTLGIKANFDMNDVLAEGSDEHDRFEIDIDWKSKFHPERIVSPIAH